MTVMISKKKDKPTFLLVPGLAYIRVTFNISKKKGQISILMNVSVAYNMVAFTKKRTKSILLRLLAYPTIR